MKSCGSVAKRERDRASMQHTLRKIQTPSMCCRCQLGRSTNRPSCLPPGRLLPSNCNCNLSLACLARLSVCLCVCLSISLSCRLSCCLPSICHGVTVEVGGNSGAPGWRLECNRLHLLKRVRVAPPTASLLFVEGGPSCIWMTMTMTTNCVWFATENGPNAKRIECNCRQAHPLLWGISVYDLLS